MNTFDYVDLGGDIRYVKDSAGQAMLATEETSTTASKAYAVGDLFRYDGKLYRVKTNITQGGTITIGTNCEETTIEEEIDKKVSKPSGIAADKFLKTDNNGNTTWGDAVTPAQISTATDAWLAQNITNPANPPLDSSLTLANAAAPADKVGELKSAIDDIAVANQVIIDVSTSSIERVANKKIDTRHNITDSSGSSVLYMQVQDSGDYIVTPSKTVQFSAYVYQNISGSADIISSNYVKAFSMPDLSTRISYATLEAGQWIVCTAFYADYTVSIGKNVGSVTELKESTPLTETQYIEVDTAISNALENGYLNERYGWELGGWRSYSSKDSRTNRVRLSSPISFDHNTILLAKPGFYIDGCFSSGALALRLHFLFLRTQAFRCM